MREGHILHLFLICPSCIVLLRAAFPHFKSGLEKSPVLLYNRLAQCAGVLELVDEVDSKSIASDGVRVRFPPPAPRRSKVRFAPTPFYACGKKDAIRPLPCSSFPKLNPLALGFNFVFCGRRAGAAAKFASLLRLFQRGRLYSSFSKPGPRGLRFCVFGRACYHSRWETPPPPVAAGDLRKEGQIWRRKL